MKKIKKLFTTVCALCLATLFGACDFLAIPNKKDEDTFYDVYETLVDDGYLGTMDEWLALMHGRIDDDGASAFVYYKDTFGYNGTRTEWIEDLAEGNLETVTLHFYLAGGKPELPDQEVPYGKLPQRPKDPVKDRYVFLYWNSYSGAFDFSKPITNKDWYGKTVSLNAVWEEVEMFTADTLDICMPDIDYGTNWMKNVAKGFTAKTGIKVNIDVTPTERGYVTALYAGTAPYDIYCLRANTYSLVTSNMSSFCVLAEYDDIYNSQVPGENILFKDKMKDMYENYNRVYKTMEDEENGEYHYYAVQWCDPIMSIVCNMDVWKDEWAIPNTTDELLAISETIKDDGYTPFIWSSGASYWWETASLWVTQYQGMEDMCGEQGFWAGYSENGVKNTPDMWKRRGILEALTVLDELVKDENGYQHELSTLVDFTTAQGYFNIPENKIAMMANGNWFTQEMKTSYPLCDLKMIPMPVISAIRNHPDCDGTIETDAELSALISAIDAGETALSGDGYSVSQKAFDKVYEARNMYGCGSNMNHIMVTPAWSNSGEQVKAFMLYLASEEGQIKYAQGNGGITHCFELTDGVRQASMDYSNNFVKSTEALKDGKQVAPWLIYKSRLFSVGGMPVSPTIELGYKLPELIFSLTGSGYKDAVEIYTENYQNAKTKWASYMLTAGLA